MKLKKVRIINFRSIKSDTISFEKNKCRVLVGINESGKTNILKALSLLSDDTEVHSGDEREQLPDETGGGQDSKVIFIFDYSEQIDEIYNEIERKLLSLSLDSNVALLGNKKIKLKKYISEISEVLFVADIKTGKKYPSLWSREEKYTIINGIKKPSESCPADYALKSDIELDKTFIVKNYSLIGEQFASKIPPEYLVDVKIQDLFEIIKRELHKTVTDYLPNVVYWKYSDDQLLPAKIGIQDFIANPHKFPSLKNMFFLAEEKKIKESIENAQKKGPTSVSNLLKRVSTKNTEYFQKVWKEYGDIKFSLTLDGDSIRCSVTEKNDFPFYERSDGFKKFIGFLLTVATRVKFGGLSNSLILIDEPDSGLHPTGARYLRDELIQISKNNWVIYSTHSIFMIDNNNIDRHLIVSKKKEVTSTEEASEGNIVKEEVIFNAIHYSTFELLKEKNVILEGWRDRKMFEIYTKEFEKTFFNKIGIAHATGVGSYKGLIPILELANRKAVILSDDDVPAKNSKAEYGKVGYRTKWLTYSELVSDLSAKTGEDFLEKSYLVSKLKTVSKNAGNEIILDPNDLPDDNRLSTIKHKIRNAGFTEIEANSLVDKFKTELFENLTKNKIEDRYKRVVNELKKYLEENL